jgi:hypothetical protein
VCFFAFPLISTFLLWSILNMGDMLFGIPQGVIFVKGGM